MTPAQLSRAVTASVHAAVRAGDLGPVEPGDVRVQCPEAGVLQTAAARPIAARLGRRPGEVATIIAERVDGAEVTGDGFLTVRAEPGAIATSIIAGETWDDPREPLGDPWADRPRTYDNPGFTVRYAYARAAAVQRWADQLEIPLKHDTALLRHPREHGLLRELAELTGWADQAVRTRSAAPLKRQLERVAEAYHGVHEQCPALPIGDRNPDNLHGARRTLAEATRIALGHGLHMIGETPRERI